MPHCKNCGNWVSDDYVRVHAPEGRETVHACPADECGMTRRGGSTPEPVRQQGAKRGEIINEELPEVSE